jgi:hypothetical protein
MLQSGDLDGVCGVTLAPFLVGWLNILKASACFTIVQACCSFPVPALQSVSQGHQYTHGDIIKYKIYTQAKVNVSK